jgi:hypothetical protein
MLRKCTDVCGVGVWVECRLTSEVESWLLAPPIEWESVVKGDGGPDFVTSGMSGYGDT